MTHNINEVVFKLNLKSTVRKPAEPTEQKLTQLDNWKLKSNVAWGLIQGSLHQHITTELEGSEAIQTTAPDVLWQSIQTKYHKKNWLQKWAIIIKLEVMHLKDYEDGRLYTAEFWGILYDIKCYNITTEDIVSLTFLNHLTHNLNLYTANISQKSRNQTAMPDTKDLFADFEQKFNQIIYNKKASVNTLYQKKDSSKQNKSLDKSKNNQNKGQESSKSNSKPTKKYESKKAWLTDQTCHHCNCKEHFIRDCSDNKKDKDLQGGESNLVAIIQIHTPACMPAVAGSEELMICDSGAHVHVFWNKSYFLNINSTSKSVIGPRGEDLGIQGIGTVCLEFNVNSVINTLTLKNALYTSLIMYNIMTTKSLKVKDFSVAIQKNNSALYGPDGMKLAILNAKHWFMVFQEVNKKQYTQAVSINIVSETFIDLWHCCLTHVNYFTIYKLSAVTEGVTISGSEAVCNLCSMVKVTQKVLCRPMTRAKEPLELVHTDLVGSVVITLTGECYYILFKNDYSDVIKVYGLKLKNQVYEKYIEYKALVKNHLKLTIKHLWTDNGTEYNNGQFTTTLKASGIQWEPSALYMQAQNSKAEWSHCTIMNMVKAVLIAQKLLKSLWIELVKACCYIWNQVSGVDPQTPYECFEGSWPDLSHLQVLKCKVFVTIPPEHRCNKLSAQFWQGVLVGYDGVNSYQVYSSLMKRVKTYCNVKFRKYETAHNTDISNKFQYAEFDKYEESETVEIDIPESINQNTSTEPSIESSIKVQDIGSPDAFQNVLPEPMNTSIAPCCSECNQQLICCWKDKFYYDFIHEIETLQCIAFISAIILSVNDDLKNLHEVMACEDWLLFQNVMN